MSDSTANLDQVSSTAIQRETTINSLVDAASPATLFGRRASTCSGLTFGFYGGRLGGTSVANGTVSLTGSTTNYVVVNRSSLAVITSTSTTNWNDATAYGRAYKVVTGSGSVTSYEDHRAGLLGIQSPAPGGVSLIVAAAAFASSLTLDLTAYSSYSTVIFDTTLTANVTTFAISNGFDGQNIVWRARQDGTGGWTWSPNSSVRFSADLPSFALSTAANSLDYIGFRWNATDTKADVLSRNRGF